MNPWTLGKTPVSEDKPTGVNIRYEPEFEALQAEMDKLSIPSVSGEMDWNKIGDMAAAILDEKSKDLLVAGYLALARLRTAGIEGLAQGVRIFRDLFETFWNDLYPTKERMRARLGAMEWWLNKTKVYLEISSPKSIPNDTRESLLQDLNALDKCFSDCFTEPPSLKPIRQAVEALTASNAPLSTHKQASLESEGSVSDAPSRIRPSPSVSSPTSQSPPSQHQTVREVPTDEKDVKQLIKNGMDSIRRAAALLKDQSPAAAVSYRLNRFAAWCEIDSLPPATDGKTLIPPPDPQVSAMLQTLRSNGNWPALLSTSEELIPQYVFWLTLNRYSMEALNGMGSPYRAAEEAVSQETAAFYQRFKGVGKLKFSDGSPLADDETIQWLQSISSVHPGADFNSAILLNADDDSNQKAMAEVIQQAQDLTRDNKLIDALALIQREMNLCQAGKERLLWRLALSHLLVSSKHADLAIPHFDQILSDIDTFHLEKWDPELALKGFKAAWSGLTRLSDKTLKSKAADILSRIARLDSTEALRMQSR